MFIFTRAPGRRAPGCAAAHAPHGRLSTSFCQLGLAAFWCQRPNLERWQLARGFYRARQAAAKGRDFVRSIARATGCSAGLQGFVEPRVGEGAAPTSIASAAHVCRVAGLQV